MDVLLVDDSEEDRTFIKKSISRSDNLNHITFDESTKMEEALIKIKNKKYDSIILDLCLPDSNGIETIKNVLDTLKANNKNTPVIILTGQDDAKIGKIAFNLGIKDFLFKNDIQPKEIERSLTFANYSKRMDKKKISKK
ncbi:MAG: response regulator [Clostridia bacterium]|jgi:DNA-binding response OmpR family regulator